MRGKIILANAIFGVFCATYACVNDMAGDIEEGDGFGFINSAKEKIERSNSLDVNGMRDNGTLEESQSVNDDVFEDDYSNINYYNALLCSCSESRQAFLTWYKEKYGKDESSLKDRNICKKAMSEYAETLSPAVVTPQPSPIKKKSLETKEKSLETKEKSLETKEKSLETKEKSLENIYAKIPTAEELYMAAWHGTTVEEERQRMQEFKKMQELKMKEFMRESKKYTQYGDSSLCKGLQPPKDPYGDSVDDSRLYGGLQTPKRTSEKKKRSKKTVSPVKVVSENTYTGRDTDVNMQKDSSGK